MPMANSFPNYRRKFQSILEHGVSPLKPTHPEIRHRKNTCMIQSGGYVKSSIEIHAMHSR